mgnify:CR=1 FL=1
MAKHITCDVCDADCSQDFYHAQIRSSDQTTVNVNKHLCKYHAELFVDALERPSLYQIAVMPEPRASQAATASEEHMLGKGY